jgi:hypothetical protein
MFIGRQTSLRALSYGQCASFQTVHPRRSTPILPYALPEEKAYSGILARTFGFYRLFRQLRCLVMPLLPSVSQPLHHVTMQNLIQKLR